LLGPNKGLEGPNEELLGPYEGLFGPNKGLEASMKDLNEGQLEALHTERERSLQVVRQKMRMHFETQLEATGAAAHMAQLSAKKAREEQRRVSRGLTREILNSYHLTNFRGETTTSLEGALCDPNGPKVPSGVGDCCAAKLLNAAAAQGLRPLGIAEFWWGAPISSKAGRCRVEGGFYNACEERCRPILGYMLCGLDDNDEYKPVVWPQDCGR
jgi:hypothetical protein